MSSSPFVASMKSFSNKRTRRNTAVAALLVWLFALSSGIANACLLEAPTKHSHSHIHSHTRSQTHSHAAKAASELHHAHFGLTEHSAALESDERHADVPKDACLKVCDDRSKAPVKLKTSSDLLDPGMPPVVALAATPVACAPCEMGDLQPPIVGPPFRVRYSRLAL